MKEPEMDQLLLRAQASPFGIAVSVTDADAFRGLFYKARKRLGLTTLSCRTAPGTPHEVWLVPEITVEVDAS